MVDTEDRARRRWGLCNEHGDRMLGFICEHNGSLDVEDGGNPFIIQSISPRDQQARQSQSLSLIPAALVPFTVDRCLR